MDGMLEGFSVALDPANLMYVLIGVIIGNVIGVLPGLGPTATIALLLPITYNLEPAGAVIMLAGIYYGTMYGGTITSVLLKLPGEAASVVTVIDGYQMTKQGRAGAALGISALGSFVGGTVSVLGLTLVAPVLAKFAVRFGPPEYFTLACVGILLITYLGRNHPVKSLCMAALGLLISTVGLDPITGSTRFTFENLAMYDGFEIAAVAMGLFGVAEILHAIEQDEAVVAVKSRIRDIWPSRSDIKQSSGAIARGSVLGFFIGILPGGSGMVSSLASYAIEKKRAKDPSRFGNGAIEGVAGPETANNAAATSSFIPLLTLGIPSNVVLALIYGALLLQGITPGPSLITDHPDIFWGVIASMYIGNVMLLLLNIPLVGLFVQLLRVRPAVLAALTLAVVMIGVYSINNRVSDMVIVVVFGFIGWIMKKTGFEAGPLVLAFVLGPILEEAFRQSMLLSDGSLSIFVTRPIAGTMVGIAAVVLIYGIVGRSIRGVRARGLKVNHNAEEPQLSRD
jgi:putative tricarboxylic transport membrane protein